LQQWKSPRADPSLIWLSHHGPSARPPTHRLFSGCEIMLHVTLKVISTPFSSFSSSASSYSPSFFF
jgi:hypothetical protein